MYINIDVDIDEVLSEATDSDIKNEAEDRGYFVLDEDPDSKPDVELKKYLCDRFDLNYHVSNNYLLEIISKNL